MTCTSRNRIRTITLPLFQRACPCVIAGVGWSEYGLLMEGGACLSHIARRRHNSATPTSIRARALAHSRQ